MSQAERFRLYDTTEIAFPRLARMGSMPSLSMVPAGGLSAIAGSSPLTVFVPQGKPASLQASLTLLSNIAGISGRVAPTTFTFTQPASGTHVLAIGTLAEMPEDTLTAAGLEPGAMRAGWTGPSGARPAVSQGPVVRMAAAPGAALPSPLPGSSTPAVTPPPLPTPPLLEAATKAREVWQRAFDWTSRQIEQTPDGRDAFQISAATSLVVAQKPALPISREAWHDFLPPLGTNGSTTVVVAPDHDKLLTTISDVFVGSFWEQFVGQAVAYDGEAERVVSRVGPPLGLVETVSPSLGNYRLVFASWLSHRRDLYIGGVLTLALVLAGLTLGLVRRMGVRER
jgi:hypothetical protein